MKLFGRKIHLSENGGVLAVVEYSNESNGGSGGGDLDSDDRCLEVSVEDENGSHDDEEKQLEEDQAEINPQDKDQYPEQSNSDENPKTPSINEDVVSENETRPENEQAGPQKTLKKPDKILPCPRCKSMDTKFCYYNNYNVNQPRHFCKSCQRYWTAGGTMRNVPVGAGRRRTKNPASHCHHITISGALEAAGVDSHNGFHSPGFKSNGTILSFGPGPPLCELISSDKRVLRNGCCKITHGGSVSCKNGANMDVSSNGPQKPMIQNLNGDPYPVPCMPGVPWSFPVPAICPPVYPMPIYPAPYWNCAMPNPWSVPWVSIPSPTANQKASNPNSPLGKHSRDGDLPNRKTLESSIVVPKTLRIDDPEDAAKSSIWETLGIEYDSVSREGLFKALQPKGKEKRPMVSVSPLVHANPAALSRSINFQEGA